MHKLFGLFFLLTVTGCFGFPQTDYDYDYAPNNDIADEVDASPVESEAPVFQEQSTTISMKEGETVSFPCKAEKETQDILIFKKVPKNRREKLIYVGVMLVDTDSKFENNLNVFSISGIRRSDAAAYICYYQAYPENELIYTLDVQFSPKVHSLSPTEQKVRKGGSVTVECKAEGNPEPTMTWSKKNSRLPSGKHHEEGVSLTLNDVSRHDEGVYVCTADNQIGKNASAAMTVKVEYPPEIITEEEIIRSEDDLTVHLICIVHARPSAEVSWSKDGEPLALNSAVTETDGSHRHTITVTEVSVENFGIYQCQASNELGGDMASISLTDEPKQMNFTSAATSSEETSYTLVWETKSYFPITEYKIKYRESKMNDTTGKPNEWTEMNQTIPDDEPMPNDNLLEHTLRHTLDKLRPATDYEVTASVTNKYKWGPEETFKFSTRKASPTTTTSSTTNLPPLAEETVQNTDEELVGERTANGAKAITGITLSVCVATLLSLVS